MFYPGLLKLHKNKQSSVLYSHQRSEKAQHKKDLPDHTKLHENGTDAVLYSHQRKGDRSEQKIRKDVCNEK